MCDYHNNRVVPVLDILYQLEIKSKYFMDEVDKHQYTEITYINFYSASYFIHTKIINGEH